ncbi:MAG TPA: GIY-YIG nuclease family protein [Chitinophagaceae bacterium]|nr:GIY-YIG nuclease family protein [Chitinophagaceae bacterium]
MKRGYVYIITNPGRTVLYVGVTSDLMERMAKHKNKFYPQSFSARYNCRLLMFLMSSLIFETLLERRKESKLVVEERKLN